MKKQTIEEYNEFSVRGIEAYTEQAPKETKSIEIMNNLKNDISLKWIPTKDQLPKESQTVWAYNNRTKFIALACLTYQEDTWLWAVSNGIIYSENNEIISECELEDDYDFTHWMELPQLPKQ